jgi:endonuclease/exonuclease/phosphatase (EEP) superfamily protein YafD
VDAYRAAHPDEVASPGYTWEAVARPADYAVHHDRIDFVLARGESLVVEEVRIVGEKSPEADLVVTPWPSDHRAVAATVRF